MPDDRELREQLVQLMRGGHAHANFEDALAGFPVKLAGVRPSGLPHSAWELLEHMRIAQEDIIEFSRSEKWVSPSFPDGYWPTTPAPERESHWQGSVAAFGRDLAGFEARILDPAEDLHLKFPWGDGQTLLREALLIADHNSYHLGQLVLVRRLLGAWTA